MPQILNIRISKPSDTINTSQGLGGVCNLRLIQYHVMRADVSGAPVFFSFPNESTSLTYSNLGTSRFPLYCNTNNDPVFLNNEIPVTNPETVYSDTKVLSVQITDVDNNPAVFDSIYMTFLVDVKRESYNSYPVTQEFNKTYGNPIGSVG